LSDRITEKWTETLDQAFGDTDNIKKGKLAEKWYYMYALAIYPTVIDNSTDKDKQLAGKDIEFGKPTWKRLYSTDVKGNMNEDGTFLIENNSIGWLRNPSKTSDRICHICTTNGKAVEYGRPEMIEYLDNVDGRKTEMVLMSTDELKGVWSSAERKLVRTFTIKTGLDK
jgi:hypothetical protein